MCRQSMRPSSLAINAAEAGDIVLVESNIYAEDLVTKAQR